MRQGAVEREDPVAAAPAAGWQRVADRLARYALLILLGAVAIAVIGGSIGAVTWRPDT